MAIGVHAAAVHGQQGAGQTAGAPSPKLVRAAHEFEGMMMKELLKPMTQSMTKPMTAGDGGDSLSGDDDDSGSAGALGEFAGESLGEALSQQGGFGIANRIVAQLSHSGNAPANGTVTKKLHSDTVMRAHE